MTQNAYVIPPHGDALTITEDILASTSVPETAPALYNGGTTYAEGAEVSVSGAHKSFDVYRSLIAGNVGNAPASSPDEWRFLGTTYGEYGAGTSYVTGDRVIVAATHLEYEALADSTGASLTDASKWQLQGYTNRWRALDLTSSTGTTGGSPMTYVIEAGKRIDAVGLSGMVADSYTVTVSKDGDVLYTYTESLSTRVVQSWKDWLTKPFTFRAASAHDLLPLVSGATITITLTRATGLVSLGALFVNRKIDLGEVQTAPDDDAQNFSRFSRNIEGTASNFIPGRAIGLIRMKSIIPAERAPEAKAAREALRYTPAFWVGLPDPTNPYFENVQTVGVWKGFRITPDHAAATLDLDLEEA